MLVFDQQLPPNPDTVAELIDAVLLEGDILYIMSSHLT
jgi:hypothetical protein